MARTRKGNHQWELFELTPHERQLQREKSARITERMKAVREKRDRRLKWIKEELLNGG